MLEKVIELKRFRYQKDRGSMNVKAIKEIIRLLRLIHSTLFNIYTMPARTIIPRIP